MWIFCQNRQIYPSQTASEMHFNITSGTTSSREVFLWKWSHLLWRRWGHFGDLRATFPWYDLKGPYFRLDPCMNICRHLSNSWMSQGRTVCTKLHSPNTFAFDFVVLKIYKWLGHLYSDTRSRDKYKQWNNPGHVSHVKYPMLLISMVKWPWSSNLIGLFLKGCHDVISGCHCERPGISQCFDPFSSNLWVI